MNTFNREVTGWVMMAFTGWVMMAFVIGVMVFHTVLQHSSRTLPPPAIHHQQDSLLNRIVTLDSLIYSLDESEAQKPIIYGKGYDRSYFRQRDTLCADRRHTTNRLNVVNSRVNNK